MTLSIPQRSPLRAWIAALAIGGNLLATTALAQQADVVDRHVKHPCLVTPAIGNSNYPGFRQVMPSNQLALPPGKSIVAAGQPVYFYARLFDRHCTPVSDAKVELWQANPKGSHRFATKAALATPDATFAGSGRTTTDNLGQFSFFTLYPGPYQYTITHKRDDGTTYKELIKRAPHFNLRVSHTDYRTFNTELFFEGDARNGDDYRLKKMSSDSTARVMMRVMPRNGDWNQGTQAVLDIVLPQRDKWRQF